MSAETLDFLGAVRVIEWDGLYAEELMRLFFPLEVL